MQGHVLEEAFLSVRTIGLAKLKNVDIRAKLVSDAGFFGIYISPAMLVKTIKPRSEYNGVWGGESCL